MADNPKDTDADTPRDDETKDEAEEQKQTDSTPGEAHREGEFRELNDRLGEVLGKLDSLLKLVADGKVREPAPEPETERPPLKTLDEIDFD